MSEHDNIYAMLVARSSLYKNYGAMMPHVGIIDNDYQGEILIPLIGHQVHRIPKGTAIAQLIFQKYEGLDLVEVTEFEDKTERAEGGFGSTDK